MFHFFKNIHRTVFSQLKNTYKKHNVILIILILNFKKFPHVETIMVLKKKKTDYNYYTNVSH